MKRLTLLLLLPLGFSTDVASAGDHWASLHYGGHQPWWNICARSRRHFTAEEKRLNQFWHNYYDAQKRYYGSLSRVDWVAYYKNHGQPHMVPGACGGPERITFAPVFVNSSMQWAAPMYDPYWGAAWAP